MKTLNMLLKLLARFAGAAVIAIASPAAASAQSSCDGLGGAVDADQVCQVHSTSPTYTIDMSIPLDYPDQQGIFPGRNSLQRLQLDGLSEVVSALVGEPLVAAPPNQSHAKCRITLASDEGLGRVHIDVSNWSGILYLSKPEDCQGGTEFFRHKRTGWDSFPLDMQEIRKGGFSSFEDARRVLVEEEGTREECWEQSMTVPMRYNRLVLLRPWLWHTAGPGFGDRLENGRLVYLMFFVRPQG